MRLVRSGLRLPDDDDSHRWSFVLGRRSGEVGRDRCTQDRRKQHPRHHEDRLDGSWTRSDRLLVHYLTLPFRTLRLCHAGCPRAADKQI